MKKTAGYSFSTQSARRAKRRIEAGDRLDCATHKPIGLRQAIAGASSEAEIKELVAYGRTTRFTYASERTRRQWSATAKRRIQQLTQRP